MSELLASSGLSVGALVLSLTAGYLFGSVPFGLVLTKPFGYDLRSIGSGNIGATNVLRTGRKDLALATLLLDSGKGAIVAGVLGAVLGSPLAALLAGMAAVIGHNFPVWLHFRGGKGVATTLGVFLITAWPVGVACCATWLVTAAVTRYSSLSALMALLLAPVYAAFWASPVHAVGFAALSLLGFVRHHENIRRLLRGQESRIGQKKEVAP